MKLPVVNITVSLNEIPDHIAVAIEIGNCMQRCKGCHSPWNGRPLNYNCWTELEYVVQEVKKHIERGANAIVLMGGTNNNIHPYVLIAAIRVLAYYAPVGLYSGLEDDAKYHKVLKSVPQLQWLKTGSYKSELGGLGSPTTNQKFWEYNPTTTEWVDKTYLFQRKENNIEKD